LFVLLIVLAQNGKNYYDRETGERTRDPFPIKLDRLEVRVYPHDNNFEGDKCLEYVNNNHALSWIDYGLYVRVHREQVLPNFISDICPFHQ
jgi:hypothetical protein